MADDIAGPRYDGWGPGGSPPQDYDPEAVTGPVPGIANPAGSMGYPREVLEMPAAGELTIRVSTGEGNELPHWTDPPTGEVPRALAGPGEGASEDEMAAWRLLGSRGLRWRDDVNDWADEPSVADLVGEDEEYAVADEGEAAQYSFDEDFERLQRQRAVPAASEPGSDQTSIMTRPPEPAEVPEVEGPSSPPPPNRSRRVRPVPTGIGAEDGTPRERRARHAKGTATPEARSSEGGRRVGTAVLAGGAMLAVFVVCYLIGPGALLALAALAIFGCAAEVLAMFQRAGFRPATLVAALGSAGAVLAAYWRGEPALPVIFVVVTGASLVWYLARVVEARPVVNVAVTLLGFAWVGVLGSYAGLLLKAPHGEHLFLAAVAPAVVADVAAWFVGSRFGQRALAPVISPSKTWEGLAAGAFAALVAGVVIGKNLAPWGGFKHGFELGLLIAIVGPVGDLAQSMLKRDLHLKDSGSLLPGHGGLFDRFDSLLFALPATYYLAIVLHLVK
jgi:phosphatidate cytidylyltransferase